MDLRFFGPPVPVAPPPPDPELDPDPEPGADEGDNVMAAARNEGERCCAPMTRAAAAASTFICFLWAGGRGNWSLFPFGAMGASSELRFMAVFSAAPWSSRSARWNWTL